MVTVASTPTPMTPDLLHLIRLPTFPILVSSIMKSVLMDAIWVDPAETVRSGGKRSSPEGDRAAKTDDKIQR